MMKRFIAIIAITGLLGIMQNVQAQEKANSKKSVTVDKPTADKKDKADAIAGTITDTTTIDTAATDVLDELMKEEGLTSSADMISESMESMGFHKQLKIKFIEGSADFMSLVALALVLGLAFCIERLIYLTLAEVNAKKMMGDIDQKVIAGDIEGAKDICRDTRGPVASVCYQGLMHIDSPADDIERSVMNYGSVQAANLEKGCSWIKLFIAIAPSLGFLGTVIGMVMSFDRIQQAGDISPTVVAEGMKVALITTIFGIVVALILQIFYNYILTKIEHLTQQMEESAITLLDIIMKYKQTGTHE